MDITNFKTEAVVNITVMKEADEELTILEKHQALIDLEMKINQMGPFKTEGGLKIGVRVHIKGVQL